MPNGREKPSAGGVTSWDFIKQNYRPGDRVAIVIRNRVRNYTLQRLLSAADAAAPRFQSYLRHENATGSDIYISMNTLKPEARGREIDINYLYRAACGGMGRSPGHGRITARRADCHGSRGVQKPLTIEASPQPAQQDSCRTSF